MIFIRFFKRLFNDKKQTAKRSDIANA